MKTAVSLPDDVFERAEILAKRAHQSRSALYVAALREYVARHAPDDVIESLNRVYSGAPAPADEFATGAARRLLEAVEW